jgi:hypothetical protein
LRLADIGDVKAKKATPGTASETDSGANIAQRTKIPAAPMHKVTVWFMARAFTASDVKWGLYFRFFFHYDGFGESRCLMGKEDGAVTLNVFLFILTGFNPLLLG